MVSHLGQLKVKTDRSLSTFHITSRRRGFAIENNSRGDACFWLDEILFLKMYGLRLSSSWCLVEQTGYLMEQNFFQWAFQFCHRRTDEQTDGRTLVSHNVDRNMHLVLSTNGSVQPISCFRDGLNSTGVEPDPKMNRSWNDIRINIRIS